MIHLEFPNTMAPLMVKSSLIGSVQYIRYLLIKAANYKKVKLVTISLRVEPFDSAQLHHGPEYLQKEVQE